jgi:hypothetical protein
MMSFDNLTEVSFRKHQEETGSFILYRIAALDIALQKLNSNDSDCSGEADRDERFLLDTYHQNADLSDNGSLRKTGKMILNNDVISRRISLNARTMVKIETQNLIISRRAKTRIESRLPMMPMATAHGMTK